MRDETQPPPGWYWLDRARGKLARNDGLSSLAEAWAEYDAEHPDAALRERLTALADAWWDKANRLQERADKTEFYERARFQVAADMARADANELRRALLTEPPKAQHPNPLCPHTLECLCDESEAHDDVFGPSGILNNGAARKEGQ
jgi:hypothetical protein